VFITAGAYIHIFIQEEMHMPEGSETLEITPVATNHAARVSSPSRWSWVAFERKFKLNKQSALSH
jgi:hypothetical protein